MPRVDETAPLRSHSPLPALCLHEALAAGPGIPGPVVSRGQRGGGQGPTLWKKEEKKVLLSVGWWHLKKPPLGQGALSVCPAKFLCGNLIPSAMG